MRMRIAVVAVLAGAAALGLSSCAAERAPGNTSSASSVVISENEALAAAMSVYGAYLAASDRVASGGWVATDELSRFETGNALSNDLSVARDYHKRGLRQTGTTKYSLYKLESYTSGPPLSVLAYICLDVSAVDIVDSEGNSVIKPGRVSRNPLEVEFSGPDAGRIRVSSSEAWSGSDFC